MPAKAKTNKEEQIKRTEEAVKKHVQQLSLFPVSGGKEYITHVEPNLLTFLSGRRARLSNIKVYVGSTNAKLRLEIKVMEESHNTLMSYELLTGLNEIAQTVVLPRNSLLKVNLESDTEFEASEVHFSADLIN